MNIKQVSELTDVPAATIRYYEKIGLIHPVKRDANGVRQFDEEDLKWIRFAKKMRHAGLSIENLTEYLTLFREGDKTIPARKELLGEQIEQLRNKIAVLTDAAEQLEYKLEHYDDHLNPFEKGLR